MNRNEGAGSEWMREFGALRTVSADRWRGLFAMALALVIIMSSATPAAPAPRAAGAEPGARGEVMAIEPDLERIRSLYLQAVENPRAIDRGLAEIDRVSADLAASEGTWESGTLSAYRGALITLRAKHTLWPATRLRHLRSGLQVLDGVLAAQPNHAEARYLRLMSCYYLPGILGRQWSVREDFQALARLLPSERDRYPRPLYQTILKFVVEKGPLTAAQRQPLEAELGRL